MDSDPQAQRSRVTAVAGEAKASSGQGDGADAERNFRSVLRDGWALIGRCRSATGEPGDDTGCFVLAHCGIGVALVDLAPCGTPNAEARLRRMLNAAGFECAHRGFLPIVHFQVRPEEMPGLGAMLDQAFAAELPLSIEGGGAWVSTLRRMLQGGVTWEGMGRKGALAVRPGGGTSRRPRGRSILPAGFAAVNLVVTFGLGFVAGILCIPSSEGRVNTAPPASGIVGATPSAIAGAGPLPATLEPSGAIGRGPAEAPQGQALADPPRPVEAPLASSHPEPAPPSQAASSQPVVTASASQIAGLPMAEGDTPLASIEAALPHEASETRSTVPQQPSRRAARTSFAIDRRCSDAVFRYQQGASLSWTEMTYIRNGCHSWR